MIQQNNWAPGQVQALPGIFRHIVLVFGYALCELSIFDDYIFVQLFFDTCTSIDCLPLILQINKHHYFWTFYFSLCVYSCFNYELCVLIETKFNIIVSQTNYLCKCDQLPQQSYWLIVFLTLKRRNLYMFYVNYLYQWQNC